MTATKAPRPESSSPRAAPRLPNPGRLLARTSVPLVAVLLAALLAACGSDSSGGTSASAEGGTEAVNISPVAGSGLEEVTWSVFGEPATLDPIYAYNYYDDQILANMCESLYRLNPDLTRSPSLAASAKRTSPTTWVYEIRKGVKFWNGHPMTAEDVAYSLSRNLSPESYFNLYYTQVKDIRATGKYEVTVELTEPNALWNQVLPVTGSAVMEKAWAEQQGKTLGSAEGGLMCTGPYELADWARGSDITLTRNDDYWSAENEALSEKIVFRFLPDPAAETQALLSGGVDGSFLNDPSGLPRLQTAPGELYFGDSMLLKYLIPTQHPSPLSDVKVRQALAMIIDRPAIAETIYHGAAEPMRTLVSRTIWGNEEAVRNIYQPEWDGLEMYGAPDIEGAKKLFEEAGSPQDPITLAFPTGGAEQQIVEAVQSSAEEIGMKIVLKGNTYAGMVNLWFDPQAQVAQGVDLMYAPFNVDATDPIAMYQNFIPKVESIYNYSGWSDPRSTRLLTQAKQTYDNTKRAELTAAAEKIVMEGLPFIPLVAPAVMAYMGEGVTGTPTSFSVMWSSWANKLGSSEGGGS